jgi:hypothetical protein
VVAAAAGGRLRGQQLAVKVLPVNRVNTGACALLTSSAPQQLM